MTAEPIVRVVPKLPEDRHLDAEGEPEEFLIGLLDWVGDQLVPNASCDHIADDLLGCWSLYQLLGFYMPHGAVRSLEFIATKMNLQDMRRAAKAAAAAISSTDDPSARQEAFEQSILSVPVADWSDLAKWAEQNITTVLLPDREAWDNFHRDLDEELKRHHLAIWHAKHREHEAKIRVAKLFRQQLEASKKSQ